MIHRVANMPVGKNLAGPLFYGLALLIIAP